MSTSTIQNKEGVSNCCKGPILEGFDMCVICGDHCTDISDLVITDDPYKDNVVRPQEHLVNEALNRE